MGSIDVSSSKRPVLETKIDDGQTWLGGGYATLFDEPGWHYVYVDIPECTYVNPKKPTDVYNYGISRSWNMLQLTIHDRDNSSYGYDHTDYKSVNQKIVIYIDDITIDYSTATDDRDAPVFSSVRWADTRMSDSSEFTRGVTAETSDNVLSFSAAVADFDGNNATGIDESTAKAYVDGVEVACTIKGGIMSVADCTLADGVHTVKFEICDKQGNRASVIRRINVKANSGKSTVKLVPHDATLDNILLGSVYYIDLVATDIEKVQSVSADIDLNNISKWELDHMEVAKGFTASYVISNADENIATVTVTRTGKTDATGEGMLVSMPVRTWELPAIAAAYKHKGVVWMYPEYRSNNEVWPIDISASVVRGEVEFVDCSTDTFTGAEVQVDTEAKYWSNADRPAEYDTWNGGHDHRADTKEYYSAPATNHVDAVALPDKAATCTEAGYTGRTFCEVCNSVVDWGTTVPATGHSYEVVDGVLKCTGCDTLFNGVWTDGKTYVDGVAIADGWNGDYYYVDGKKVTGIYAVDGVYYNFGDDGRNQGKYTGLVQVDGKWCYSKLGSLTGGWVQIDENWHYFRSYTKTAVTGEYTVNGVTYQFDETGMTKGAWHKDDKGARYYYGPSYYRASNPGYLALYEIEGKTYNFGNDGYITLGEIQVLQDAASLRKVVYRFADDGSVIERVKTCGLITDFNGDMYYIGENGEISLENQGLIKVDGAIYYVKPSGKIAVNETKYISAGLANGLIEVESGYVARYFGADGKLEQPFTGIKAGEDGILYYYVNDKVASGNPGLIKLDGAIYYVKPSGKIAVNETKYISAGLANGLIEVESGYVARYFGADGKLEQPFTGIKAGEDGILYYYVNDKVASGNPGLIELDGAIYYVKPSGKIAVNETKYISAGLANGLIEVESGYVTRYFGADGKLEQPFTGIKAGEDGILYYYVNDKVASGNPGLIKLDGAIYYVKPSGKIAVNETKYISAGLANGLIEVESGYVARYFDADGKMVINN